MAAPGTVVLRSLLIVVVFLKIFHEFRNNFLEENLKKASPAILIKSPFSFLRTVSRKTPLFLRF